MQSIARDCDGYCIPSPSAIVIGIDQYSISKHTMTNKEPTDAICLKVASGNMISLVSHAKPYVPCKKR
jgi:hypothetical protein